MAIMNRARFRKELQEGLNTVFGMEYRRYGQEWRPIFEVENSQKAYEEDVLLAGLAGAPVKAEGAPVACPSVSSPQHSTKPLSARTPQV